MIAAYLAYWTAGSEAERSGNATRARAILAPYVTAPYLQYMISGKQCLDAIQDIAPDGEPHPDTVAVYRELTSGTRPEPAGRC